MKSVIYIDPIPEKEKKPVEFTHMQGGGDDEGWNTTIQEPNDFGKVVYLGKCSHDGDMFAAYTAGQICIFKGYLNSGKY